MSELTFGQRVLAATSPSELLAVEVSEGRSELFADVDVVVAGLMIRALRGDRILELTRSVRQEGLAIVGIPETLRASLRKAYQLEEQQSRGAWFLPESVSLKLQRLLFPAHFAPSPRYAHTLAADDRLSVTLKGNPDAMVVWSVLEPFANILLEPIFLRVEKSGLLTREEFTAKWMEANTTLGDLGISIGEELRPLGWGGGWARFSVDEQIACKARFLAGLADKISGEVVRRYRALVTKCLVEQYYTKAKKGRAKRRQVITKEHSRTLAGFFAGDWLAFVRYLGEEPHEEERIVTALPEAKVIVRGKSSAAAIAEKQGVPVEEVERILGTFWNNASQNSPVLDRIAIFSDYWKYFDAIHIRQAPGMIPLWGLVEDGGWENLDPQPYTPHQPELYRRLLPAELNARIEKLWGTTVLAKWPEVVVSEPFPHSKMAHVFGPALKFWHGCALTAWFVCEGPMSRTDIPGLAEYYAGDLAALRDVGTPVHPQLFQELSAVRLGPEEPKNPNHRQVDLSSGLSIDFQISSDTRRRGFEQLRDIITRYRQWWAGHFLEPYLRGRWEIELKATARQFHMMTEERNKPPTIKQFIKYAVTPAARWFGGDIGVLYAAIGQKLPGAGVTRSVMMPANRVAFVESVFGALGGSPFTRKIMVSSEEEGRKQAGDQERHRHLRRLAGESLSYVQLFEAIGRPPTQKEFGAKFEWQSKGLHDDPSEAWKVYSKTVDAVLYQSQTR